MDRLVARRWRLVPAAAVVGAAIGLLVSLAGSTSRRAEAAVLISSSHGPAAVTPMLPDLRELATSSVLAGNVRSTLRLSGSEESVRHRLHASIRPHSQVIVIAATDAKADRARQLSQEAAVVFTQLVGARFGAATPPLHASVLDAAHALSGPDRHFERNALIGAGAGLVLGTVAVFLLGGGMASVADGASAAVARDLRRREQLVDERVKVVTARERELARRAGQLAVRERDLEARAAALPPPPRPEPEREPEPVPLVPEPEPIPAPAPSAPPTAGWNVNDLERLVATRSSAAPEMVEQWQTYLFFLREHAAIDGSLPLQFDGLVAEVFADLVEP